ADVVPGCYEDFEQADLIVLVGSNTAWCHPVIQQRIAAAKERRPELMVVVVDPRRTPTSELSDLHLPLRSGTDVWLFNGLAAFLKGTGITKGEFVRRHPEGGGAALAAAEATAGSIDQVAAACGLEPALVLRFYQLFAQTDRTVTAFSQGVNQSSS